MGITYTTRKLVRYIAAPRVAYWEAAKHVFWTFEKHPKLAIPVDPTPLKSEPSVPFVVKSYDAELALFKSLYTDSTEDRDPNAIPSLNTGTVLTPNVDAICI